MKRIIAILSIFLFPSMSHAWFNVTHLAIAKAAGYSKWYNAAETDIAKENLGNLEGRTIT